MNRFELASDVREEINKEVNRLGYKIIDVRSTSDDSTKVVLAHSEKKEEFVTWMYNCNKKGLFSGNYFTYWYDESKENAKDKAYRDFFDRK